MASTPESNLWIKFSVDFADHPKAIGLGAEACWMYVQGLCYSKRYLTDGLIPKSKLPTLAEVAHWQRCTDRLVAAGLWRWERGRKSIIIDGFLDWQTSAEEVESRRQLARDRQRRARERKANSGNGHGSVTRDERVTGDSVTRESRDQRTEAEAEAERTTLATAVGGCEGDARRSAIFEAVMTICKVAPADLTKSARSAVNSAVRQLIDAGASPGEIEARAGTYHRLYPSAQLTPSALAKHWPQLTLEAIPLSSFDIALAELGEVL